MFYYPGGLDSFNSSLSGPKPGIREIYAITFEYGQKHDKELKSAIAIAKAAGVKEHKIVNLLLNHGADAHLPSGHGGRRRPYRRQDIPSTYVPARNMVFLSVAASWADALDITDIFIGVSEVDYSGYVDCREEFIKAMENAINLGTVLGAEKKQRITHIAPFMHLTKAEEVKLGVSLGVDFGLTWTCYRGGEHPCGVCDSCLLRAKAFAEANEIDPLVC